MDKVTDVKFKELLSKLQKELLKQKGFKKSGQNFRLFLPDGTCKIINFQKSMFNGYGECEFTVNIGLYFQKDLENPYLQFKEYDCTVRARVQDISPRYRRDQWWIITKDTDSDLMYSELCVLMKDDVLPWLDQFTTWQDVIHAGQAGKLQHMIWGSIYVNI